MTEYLNGHAFGNATTEDLRAALEASSGRDLSAFFAEWVYGVGYPTYETSWSARAVTGEIPGGHPHPPDPDRHAVFTIRRVEAVAATERACASAST